MRSPWSTIEPWLRAPLTYPEVGATAGELPPGYAHVDRCLILGRDREVFERASQALWSWEVHRGAGLHVIASGPASMIDAVVVSTLGLGRFGLAIPCRVVAVIDEPDRRGFAYGTLPGHPEQGEERFVVSLADDGTVTFDIRAFSRPGSVLTRVGAPVARGVQTVFTTRYLSAARRLGALGSTV